MRAIQRRVRVDESPRPAESEFEALQRALAAEHTAVFGYGLVGADLEDDALQRAQAAHAAHRARRDRLAAILRTRGITPTPAAPAYAPAVEVSSGTEALALAVLLEERVAATYAEVVAATTGDRRELAARALAEAAVRAAGWRGSTVPFPGLSPE